MFNGWAMPNAPAPDRAMLSIRIPLELKRCLEVEAAAQRKSLTELCEDILTLGTKHVKLTPDDYRKIAQAIEDAIRERDAFLASRGSRARAARRNRDGSKKPV